MSLEKGFYARSLKHRFDAFRGVGVQNGSDLAFCGLAVEHKGTATRPFHAKPNFDQPKACLWFWPVNKQEDGQIVQHLHFVFTRGEALECDKPTGKAPSKWLDRFTGQFVSSMISDWHQVGRLR